jgi:2-dehydropantoate 2-reductase
VHVAIVGAGALGRVYGVRLALRAASGVTLVVRAEHAVDALPLRIARVDGDRAEEVWERPVRSTAVPADADVVLVAVRVEQLDASLDVLLDAAPTVPVVVLTPMMPIDFVRLSQRHARRIFSAMPGVVAYVDVEGACRYWLPRVAATLIDEPTPANVALLELVTGLTVAGIPARLELAVHETNPATTVAFIPLAMGIDVAGSIDALVADGALRDLAVRGAREGLELSRRIGEAAAWAGALARFTGPTSLRIGVAIAKSRYPEALAYVESHFGRKLHAQNLVMAKAMVDLARAKHTPHDALDVLLERLRGAG